MSEIIIPERLAIRLSHDKTWDSCVTQLKKNIEPLLAKDPDFFPDYTIHGIDHINRCLDIADRLIDFDTLSEEPEEKKKDLLMPRDVAFLVCGIILHDMGMFLRPDGVRKLVQMDSSDDAFGGKSWKQEWSDYVDRTKRLSQEKMRYHFGKVIPVTEDCVDHTDTDDNKRIIGEFLRQHHARLAHEFALGMLPGTADTDLFENMTLPQKARDLIGILARSHGMAIRDIELYVKNHIGEGTKPYNTPVFYLMTVLRTADALDADERRAPEALERQQKIHVPISVEEWTWNQCIDPYASDWRKQHKSYHVEANPKSSPQYVQLNKWLKNVQADLDLCWSILAEKYPCDRYRLSIHRVVSNIHEPGIQETMNEKFLTKEVKITANPEIVKLLMEPLYGDDPTYGVRELLQNAVDACIEREHVEHREKNAGYKGVVDIEVKGDTFVITDNGMGMNEDILLNYYLCVGSTYRSSDTWKADYAPDNHSEVARSGQFGVGFLAGFLLGDSITVHTQHRDDKTGYVFQFSMKSVPLDMKRIPRNEGTGTTITIVLKKGIREKLLSDSSWYSWYGFDDPIVRYTFDGEKREPIKTGLSRSKTEEGSSWLEFQSASFPRGHWKPVRRREDTRFYCNGILIPDFPYSCFDSFKFGLTVLCPSLSVIDYDSNLEINLSRSKVLSFPAFQDVLQQIYRYQVARLLLTQWNPSAKLRGHLTSGFCHLRLPFDDSIPYLLSENGFILNHVSVLALMGIWRYLALLYQTFDPCDAIRDAYRFTPSDVPVCIVHAFDDIRQEDLEPLFLKQENRPFSNFCSTFSGGGHSAYETGYHPGSYQGTIWLKPSGDRYIENAFSVTTTHRNVFVCQENVHKWIKQEAPVSPKDEILLDTDAFAKTDYLAAVEIRIPPNAVEFQRATNPSNDSSLFARILAELLTPAPDYPAQDMWIPFDMEERKKKFPKAFEELAAYMDHIRKYSIE